MKYVLALDQGTTSSRAILFDRKGRQCAIAQKEFRQFYPKPGWVEHDPSEIWTTQRQVALSLIKKQGLQAKDIAAIGITNQRETTVIWDRKTGRPIHHALVWQDRRTAALCEALHASGATRMIRDRTGLVPDPYFSGTKIRWLLDHVRGARRRAERGELAFGTIDTWLLWNLTGGRVHATDPSNASRTMLFNIKRGCWDDDLLDRLAVPRALLPEVRTSSEVYAETSARGWPADIPIAGIAGDQQAALFGQACFKPGMAKNTYGTGCFLLMHTGDRPVRSKNKLLTTIAWRIGDKTEYALEGSVFTGGAVVQWFRDGLGLIQRASEIDDMAATVKDTDGVYLVPAFTGLGAPHWDPYARGTIVGLTRGTTAAHLARAALESIAYQSSDVLRAMEADAGIRLKELRVDGGASASAFLMQFQADLLRVPVVRPRVTETTALGAACLAGLAVGFWESREELASRWSIDHTFKARRARAFVKSKQAGWERALKCARAWASP